MASVPHGSFVKGHSVLFQKRTKLILKRNQGRGFRLVCDVCAHSLPPAMRSRKMPRIPPARQTVQFGENAFEPKGRNLACSFGLWRRWLSPVHPGSLLRRVSVTECLGSAPSSRLARGQNSCAILPPLFIYSSLGQGKEQVAKRFRVSLGMACCRSLVPSVSWAGDADPLPPPRALP